MMLARSPVPTTPANASPRTSLHSFHYAPAPSPRQSSPRALANVAKSCRQSNSPSPAATSIASSKAPQPKPKRYVAVDAATQYSPMEPMDYATGTLLPRVTISKVEPQVAQPAPAPETMALPNERPAADPQPSAQPPKPAAASAKQRMGSSSQIASPSKRKNSQGPSSRYGGMPAEASQNPSTLSKRPKPDTAPPKVLPIRYENCDVEDMVVLIAHMLGELIETNDTLALKAGHLTRFHSRTAPGISVLDYLHRLAKHATLSPPLLLSMVYYIDRLCALYPDFTINTLTVHRFLITAATVAAKGLSDAFWNNSTYARVGGVKLAELKLLELEFLHRVDWKIVPNPEVLVAYYRGLVDRCPGYELEGEDNGGNAAAGDNDDDDDDDEDDELDDDDSVGEPGNEGVASEGETKGSMCTSEEISPRSW